MIEKAFTNTVNDTETFRRAADILRTVAHPVRLGIIDFLEAGEKPVAQICIRLGVPQPSISQHLNLMKAKGILVSRRNGTQVMYSVGNRSVIDVIHCVREHCQ
jgi:ArsR family transcriptional regulator